MADKHPEKTPGGSSVKDGEVYQSLRQEGASKQRLPPLPMLQRIPHARKWGRRAGAPVPMRTGRWPSSLSEPANWR